MTEKTIKLKKTNGKYLVELIICRVDTCRKPVLPKIDMEKKIAVYPERCPDCRNKYWNQPYIRADKV